jgi:hypothetical protein
LALRQLATDCPTDYARIAGGRTPDALAPATAILRERESVIARQNTIAAERPKVEAAMEAYTRTFSDLVAKYLAAESCTATFSGLGLEPLPPGDLASYARDVPLPTSRRPDAVPPLLDTGTNATLALQRRILIDLAAEPRRCRPDGAVVKPMAIEPVLTRNLPPFVGAPLSHEEAWTLSCAEGRRTFTIEFIQDARRWRSYSIKDRP